MNIYNNQDEKQISADYGKYLTPTAQMAGPTQNASAAPSAPPPGRRSCNRSSWSSRHASPAW